MITIELKKGETLKQAVIRLNREMLAEWGRRGGSVGGKTKSDAAIAREARKRGIRYLEISTTVKEFKTRKRSSSRK